jgi:hypothetical protein
MRRLDSTVPTVPFGITFDNDPTLDRSGTPYVSVDGTSSNPTPEFLCPEGNIKKIERRILHLTGHRLTIKPIKPLEKMRKRWSRGCAMLQQQMQAAPGGAFKVIRYSREKSAFTLKEKDPITITTTGTRESTYCMWSILPSGH